MVAKITKYLCILLCLTVISCAVFFISIQYLLKNEGSGSVYETNNIADYGNYIGNYDNNTPQEFITSFFPDAIHENYSNVTYHYKAKKFDTYAYEAYLEFIIEDTNAFNAFLDSYVEMNESVPFKYDESFMEYSISNVLNLQDFEAQENIRAISFAEIGKILFSTDQQRIAFVAIGVYDGGGTTTAELGFFFDRFEVSIADYEQNSFFSHEDQENNILYKDRLN